MYSYKYNVYQNSLKMFIIIEGFLKKYFGSIILINIKKEYRKGCLIPKITFTYFSWFKLVSFNCVYIVNKQFGLVRSGFVLVFSISVFV